MAVASALVVVFALAAIIGTSESLCIQEPGRPYNHYTELGCTPIYTKNGCIERYDCPFMKTPLSPEKCSYKNQIFSIGDLVPKSIIDHDCTPECTCTHGFGGRRARFTCPSIHCPEFNPRPGHRDCVHQYETGKCCSVNEICDKKKIAALKTCTWDSKVYREGQKFYPETHCKVCICSKNFDGTIKAPWCRDINCGIELHDGTQARRKCAPIYGQTNNCCPQTWKCFEEKDTIVRTAVRNANPEMKCHYGDQILEVGDKINGEDRCIVCSCDVPPLAICTRLSNC